MSARLPSPCRRLNGRAEPPALPPRGARIRRRALELGLFAYRRCLALLREDLSRGRLSEDAIELWEPAPATRMIKALEHGRQGLDAALACSGANVPATQILLRVRAELELARSIAGLLFP